MGDGLIVKGFVCDVAMGKEKGRRFVDGVVAGMGRVGRRGG